MTDLCTGQELAEGRLPEPLSLSLLSRAGAMLAERNSVSLRFVSPLRLKRHRHTQVKGHTFLDEDLFEGDRLIENLVTRVSRLAPDAAGPPPDGEMLNRVQAQVRHLMWLDLPKHDVSETTGGVVGEVELFFPETVGAAASYLLLGQYLGAGKDISFGFGRYRVLDDLPLPRLPVRAETLGAAAARLPVKTVPEPLYDEYDEDEADWEEFLAEEDDLGREELASLADGTRNPQPYSGRVMTGPSGKARALAVPSAIDQSLQRRVQQILYPSVETLLESSSFAYRRGLSRHGAAAALRRAYDRGLRWVLRADIAAFFDSVKWDILRWKLEALWDDDPIVDLLMRWTRAPVRFGARLINRDRGLPQGAVLSPLLANLYLDQFDEEVTEAGFKLVRYADDFVICCKNREEAELARTTAARALADLSLELNDRKERLTNFEEGFTYLGYVFCRSMILGSDKEKKPSEWLTDTGDAPAGFWAEAIRKAPKGAWLAGLKLDPDSRLTSTRIRRVKTEASREGRATDRRPVYISDPDLRMRTYKGRLLLGDDRDDQQTEIPLSLIESLICFGYVPLTAPVIQACLKHSVPIYLCTTTGALLGHLALPEDEAAKSIIESQTAFCRDPALCLDAAGKMIAAKIHNSRLVIRRRHGRDREDDLALEDLKDLMNEAGRQDRAETLRAVEGRAAGIYFDRLAANLPGGFGFEQRRQRPAPDPVNAMLNLGYTLLYRQTSALIRIERLHPAFGIFHVPSDRFHALASDIMEEFRHLVELIILRAVHLGQITPEDFSWHEKRAGCLIDRQAMQVLIKSWQKKMEDTIVPEPAHPQVSMRELIHRQVKRMKQVFLNPGQEEYQAYRGR